MRTVFDNISAPRPLARGIHLLAIVALCIGLVLVPTDAFAKKRKKKVVRVKLSDIFTIDVSLRSGRKVINQELACYKKKPGRISETRKGLAFNSLDDQLKKMRQAGKQKSKKYKLTARLLKASKKDCANPKFLALTRYKGNFGEKEAKILFERFAFGGSPQQIDRAVRIGLAATVTELTTYQPDARIDAQVADITCDTYLATNPWNGEPDNRNESCNPYYANDFRTDGLRKALSWRMTYSNQPFFDRLFFWLHDERLSVNLSVVGSDERHALATYVGIVDRAARTGDYKQYMRSLNTDHLMALDWLDGAVNRGFNPNENWAREFWELGTTGPSDLNGNPVYSNFDIAQAALAHSGWTFVTEDRTIPGEDDERRFRYASFTPGFHYQGPTTIFGGTPHQAVVYDADDVLEATFRHPSTAESLALDMCHQFIRPDCPAILVRDLAKTIRTENYNLLPAFRRVMMSNAVYANDNRESLIKHPVELLIGFVRQTGINLTVDELDWWLNELDQRPLNPNSVFGWNETALAGESYVLAWRNVVLDIVNGLSPESLLENRGYDMHARYLSDNPSALVAIDRVASGLNIPLNEAQRQALEQYMNFHRTTCRSWHVQSYGCTEGELFLERRQFDSYPQGNWDDKLRPLIGLLAMLPEYRMK